jgi:prepilin-type N-terminal cleavage/methylation domain-containing protein
MISRTGSNRGFSLIEVMVAVSVLALGSVLIYQSFFMTLNAFNYCRDYLAVTPWIDEKIWQVQDSLMRLGDAVQLDPEGGFAYRNKDFKWNLSYRLIDSSQHLYKIDLALYWQEGQRKAQLIRSTYEIYEKKE